ncbi:MAG: aldose 1-epimerase [Acidobacteria bacterium]|nr:aldose 1-epimerase [Acidobacteriota bacterium]
MRSTAWLWILILMPAAAQYSARRATHDGIEIVRLEDRRHATTVSVAPSIGNIAYEMKVKGNNVFWFPFASVGEFQKKPALCGNPLLAPWANRLDENGFYANGKKYLLNLGLGNIRPDGFQHPIHGLLLFASDWKVTSLQAGAKSAHVTSRLEFFRRPEWMAQFPFAHAIEMTYTLGDGALEVATRVENQSVETMPLSLGYHPYFEVPDAPRDDWTVGLAAASEWLLNEQLIPTGHTRPIRELVPDPAKVSLRGRALDNVFGDLVRDSAGRAVFWVQGKTQKIEVVYGPKYPVAVVYAPTGVNRNFICFEPMTGITNAFNLAHRGVYKALQTIPAGQSWQESYWIRPSGF